MHVGRQAGRAGQSKVQGRKKKLTGIRKMGGVGVRTTLESFPIVDRES